ncbi:hypothetical protein PCCS19_14240 [Paenibacillus sp. CCS19]|uniref:LysM peptidoglycan-binding domain-containing protein n=1 Tax=Paenibacillus sp. CCS19 TaxID=3158387 RepID=UPI00256D267D|nr:LysM peptidoglycan-binding domain-containing protein [Paenibacillus cellulosilyticus]GMK38370.1 hypothetical protein PCCS19_14240 [Paenibacillus cellulosilyticus]
MKIHIVKSGDTLFWLAQKYGVSVEEIVKLNPSITNPDAIEVGMKVKIPSNPHGAHGSNGSHAGEGIMHQHVVKQGDTLWKLSKAWGIPLNDLIKANPQLKNPNVLLTGDIVNIPKSHVHAESIVNQMNAQGTEAHHNSNHFSPSSIKNSVQGLAGKIPTGIIPGKKNTGKVPTAPITKTPTGPIAEALPEAPVTLPAPAPAPAPIVVEKPVPKPYPVHVEYHQQNVHLFQQCGIPAVEAGAVYGVPHMPEQVSPVHIGPEHYGYGSPLVSPANIGPEHHGYGSPLVSPTNIGPEHYGYGSPLVSPANVGSEHHGYGSPLVSPANLGPEHYGYGSPIVSPANIGPEQQGYGSPLVSPANIGPEHHGYGSPLVSPANVGPEQYGYGSPLVSPANVGPEQYGYGSPLVSPANVGPEQYGYGSPLVSPANVGPELHGYGAPVVSPTNLEHYGYGVPTVSPAGTGDYYGYGSPSAVDPFAAGQSQWPYGAYPTWPVQQAANDKDCGCNKRQEVGGEESLESDTIKVNQAAGSSKSVKRNAPRKPVKKVAVRSVSSRPAERKRSSKPWINN